MFLSCCRTIVGGLYLCFLCFIQSLGTVFVLSLLHTVVGGLNCDFLLRAVTLAALSMRSCFVSKLSSWIILCHSLAFRLLDGHPWSRRAQRALSCPCRRYHAGVSMPL